MLAGLLNKSSLSTAHYKTAQPNAVIARPSHETILTKTTGAQWQEQSLAETD